MLTMGERVLRGGLAHASRVLHGTILPTDPEAFHATIRWIRAEHVLVQLFIADPHAFEHVADEGYYVDLGRRVVAIAVLGDGRIEGTFAEGSIVLHRGDAVVLDSKRDFTYVADGPIRLLTVFLDAERVPEHLRDTAPLPAGVLPRTRLLNSYIAFVSAMLANQIGPDVREPDEHLSRALEDLQVDVIAEAHGDALPEPGSDGLRYRIAEYVDAHLGDPELGPGSIANELGISLRYAHQVFNRSELTLARFVRERRLAAVAAVLSDPDVPMRTGELALRYGFGSRDQLARAFRRRYGMTMREYRDAGENRPD